MVQKETAGRKAARKAAPATAPAPSAMARRGRPRTHDPDTVLLAAAGLFWERGFEGASLDGLAKVMGMNRPSIYLAFGDKDALYRRAMDHFVAHLGESLSLLERSTGLREGLVGFFEGALRVYGGGLSGKGCLVMCTAPSIALTHPDVRADLAAIISRIDTALERRIERARNDAELPADMPVRSLAMTLQAILHSVALRSRAGEPVRSLRRFVRASIDLCLDSAGSAGGGRR